MANRYYNHISVAQDSSISSSDIIDFFTYDADGFNFFENEEENKDKVWVGFTTLRKPALTSAEKFSSLHPSVETSLHPGVEIKYDYYMEMPAYQYFYIIKDGKILEEYKKDISFD